MYTVGTVNNAKANAWAVSGACLAAARPGAPLGPVIASDLEMGGSLFTLFSSHVVEKDATAFVTIGWALSLTLSNHRGNKRILIWVPVLGPVGFFNKFQQFRHLWAWSGETPDFGSGYRRFNYRPCVFGRLDMSVRFCRKLKP